MKTLRSFFKKVLGNDSGFSIVQGLAVAAALGGVSLVLMQQNKISNQQSRTAATSVAVIELQAQVQNYLLLETACRVSLSGPVLKNDGDYGPINSIKNATPEDVFVKNQTYLNNQVQIEDMIFARKNSTTGVLTVTFNKIGNANNRGTGAAQVKKEYEVNAQWDTDGHLVKCYSDIGNAIDTAVEGIMAGLCKDVSSSEANGLFFDAAAGFCQLTQLGTASMTDLCPADQAVNQVTYDPTTRQYSKVCGLVYKIPPSCDTDSLLRRRSDGTFDCVKPVCGPNQIFQGLNGSGASICIACGNGQVAMSVNGIWQCSPMACTAPNTYFLGLDIQGQPICNSLIESNTCPSGGKLIAAGGGRVKFDCCTPNCGDTSTKCAGTVYNSSNSCGTCTGTGPALCADPATMCVGSYPASNGCGSCEGTKPAQAGVWGTWSNTSEYRVKSGAICSCSTNQVAREVKQVRGCTQPQCGGAACSGDSEQWVDAGTQACTPTGCTPPGKCTGYGSDSTLFTQSSITEVQNGCRTQYRDVYMDINIAQFKIGNIYSITQGNSFTAEVVSGDTPTTVLQRIASKINAANMTYPTLCNGAGSTVVTNATVTGNRLKYHINWQHQPAFSGSRSCNIANETDCRAATGCNWDTTSANLCTGWNYTAKVGTCNGKYYQQGCTSNDPNSGNGMNCRYSYDTQSECNSAPYNLGCYWGSIEQTCYAGSQSECNAVSGCSWQSFPDVHRSCTAAYEYSCTGEGASACTWGPR